MTACVSGDYSHAFTSPISRKGERRIEDLPPPPQHLQEVFYTFIKLTAHINELRLSAGPTEGAGLGEASPFHGVSVQALPSSSVSYLNHAGVFRKTPGSKRQAENTQVRERRRPDPHTLYFQYSVEHIIKEFDEKLVKMLVKCCLKC